MEKFSDREVCTKVGLSIDSLNKIRALLRQRGVLVKYQQIDEELLKIIACAKDIQAQLRCSWEKAITEAQYRNELDRRIFDKTAESYASELFREACKNRFGADRDYASEYFVKTAAGFDFLASLGYSDISKMLRNQEDIIIKAIAFDFAYQNRASS